MPLTGKIAVVTGASRGIGRALAKALSQDGATVVVVARPSDDGSTSTSNALDETVKEINDAGGTVHGYRCNLTKEDQIRQLVERINSEVGQVDILVNNAAIAGGGSIPDFDVSAWDAMMATNVRAPFLLSQLLLPGMMERKQGSIVNITSRVSEREIPRVFAYSTSKAALNRLTLNTAAFAKEANVAVNALCPGRIKSDDERKLNPASAPASDVDQEPPESVAPPVVWLAGQDASFTGNIVYREEFGKSWGL